MELCWDNEFYRKSYSRADYWAFNGLGRQLMAKKERCGIDPGIFSCKLAVLSVDFALGGEVSRPLGRLLVQDLILSLLGLKVFSGLCG